MNHDILYFVGKALDNWCKANRWNKDLPLTPAFLLMIINDAIILQEQERKRVESEPTV